MNTIFRRLIFTSVFTIGLVFVNVCFAQAPPDGGFDDPDAEVPIDGGIGILAAAGVAYGAKKIRDHRKSNHPDTL